MFPPDETASFHMCKTNCFVTFNFSPSKRQRTDKNIWPAVLKITSPLGLKELICFQIFTVVC